MKEQGIYKLENLENKNIYIGQSSNINKRKDWHKKDLMEGKHHQFNLQKEFNERVNLEKELNKDNKYSNYIDYESYVFDTVYSVEPLQLVDNYDKDSILDLEDEYILKYRAIQKGYKQLTNKEIQEKYNAKKFTNQIDNEEKLSFIAKDLKMYFIHENKKIFVNAEKINFSSQWDKEYMYMFYRFLKYIQFRFGYDELVYDFNLTIEKAIYFFKEFNDYYFNEKNILLSFNNRQLLTKKSLCILLSKCKFSIKYDKQALKENKLKITVNYELLEKDMFLYYLDILETSKLFPSAHMTDDICKLMEVK